MNIDALYFPPPGSVRLNIKPASYGPEQRIEAAKIAESMGMGVVMELHSSSTHFYADPKIPVRNVAIYSPPAYKANSEYVTTLTSPDQEWPERKELT